MYESSFFLVSGSGKGELVAASSDSCQLEEPRRPLGCALVAAGHSFPWDSPVRQPLLVHVLPEKCWHFQSCLNH